jgi:probable rRNA maturation factor
MVNEVLVSPANGKEWKINIILISDEIIIGIHEKYLNDNSPTDVISFDLCEEYEDYNEGEIYISIDRTKAQAGEFGVSFKSELYRLIAHGTLHLLGYNDLTDEDRQKMRQQEDNILQKFNLF